MKQHPYADILRALADGHTIEAAYREGDEWKRIYFFHDSVHATLVNGADGVVFRIAPEKIQVGRAQIDAPLRALPKTGTVWIANIASGVDPVVIDMTHWDYLNRWLESGLLFDTEAKATACVEALTSLTRPQS